MQEIALENIVCEILIICLSLITSCPKSILQIHFEETRECQGILQLNDIFES